MRDAPTWWDWPFVMGDHVLERMPERGFNEVDLREMIEEASGWFPDHLAGRFVLQSHLRCRRWEVVVEPQIAEQRVFVVTAFQVDEP